MTYPFTEAEMERAATEWGANCGPSALAFALQVPIESVRHAIPDFEDRHYTSPTMMKSALENLRTGYSVFSTSRREEMLCGMFSDRPALVRIQWGGPWCAPGVNPKWAYRQTHWIATWMLPVLHPGDMSAEALDAGAIGEARRMVFDCNGGAMQFERWRSEIVSILTDLYARADGTWFPTHIWRIAPNGGCDSE